MGPFGSGRAAAGFGASAALSATAGGALGAGITGAVLLLVGGGGSCRGPQDATATSIPKQSNRMANSVAEPAPQMFVRFANITGDNRESFQWRTTTETAQSANIRPS